CVVASGTMLFSPAIRLASSTAGATTCGAVGVGGGAGTAGDAVVVATGGVIVCGGGGGGGGGGGWGSGSGAVGWQLRVGGCGGVATATRVGRSFFAAGAALGSGLVRAARFAAAEIAARVLRTGAVS